MKSYQIISKSNFYTFFLIVSCFLSNISQIPSLIGNQIIKTAYYLLWIGFLILLCFLEKKLIIKPLFLPILFDVIIVLLSIITKNSSYLQSNLFRPVNLCTFIMLIGFLSGKYIDEKQFKKIAISFVVSSIIVAFMIYYDYFRGVDWAGTSKFLYSSKNSAGQIFLTAIILLLLLFVKDHKFTSYLLTTLFMALIFIMKSRAVIVGVIVTICYIIFFIIENKRSKRIAVFLLVSSILAVFLIPSLHKLVINQILLNNHTINNLDGITSGRIEQYEYFKYLFPTCSLIGTGNEYIESFPLACLLSYGIIGSVPIIIYSFYPIISSIKNKERNDIKTYRVLALSLNIMMLFTGIFEEQSPFGPGVKCYFLWLITGIMLGIVFNKKEEIV